MTSVEVQVCRTQFSVYENVPFRYSCLYSIGRAYGLPDNPAGIHSATDSNRRHCGVGRGFNPYSDDCLGNQHTITDHDQYPDTAADSNSSDSIPDTASGTNTSSDTNQYDDANTNTDTGSN